MQTTVPIYVEATSTRAFAGAIEWPGWSRGARTEEQAIEALAAYGRRYSAVARRAGLSFAPPGSAVEFEVVQRLPGGASTDYGIPSLPPAADERSIDEPALARLEALLQASWDTFDANAERAVGVQLRTGPRGGGRSLEKIEEHVRMAEQAYLTQLGARPPAPDGSGASGAAGRGPLREALLSTLAARARDTPVGNPSGTRKRWLPRYFVRRTAWHALDHAWEIEDRMIGADGADGARDDDAAAPG
ncbi:MAG TPA: hypothetical protein VNF73_06880 [Candidatus Saccharimonadales bacterium]|nr:hypothetical protein [Candidatus Saccharimonadales bacterium]